MPGWHNTVAAFSCHDGTRAGQGSQWRMGWSCRGRTSRRPGAFGQLAGRRRAWIYWQEMSDPFELLDPSNARTFLKDFGGQAQRKGEAHFHSGRVQDLAANQPGIAYSAVINDGEPHEGYVQYDAGK